MAKPREIRITFKEKEDDLYRFIQGKSSASAFLKDLARLEQKKEEIYLNNLKNESIEVRTASDKVNEVKKEETINLPDISDLE
ncbi:hypothetical protein LI064_11840 [Clostridium perfringens]|uniref:hypothetical protein n=1 Tax=Clostridium perfringens TaxID=1502 RepID=UPI002245FDE2|nr:hypothetical protein [Clostridium perfringens]MCX0355207.1 hypothetical protein [Clostridium perfringens]MDM0612907.1 hypothetical protein [Clostridium perfringens]